SLWAVFRLEAFITASFDKERTFRGFTVKTRTHGLMSYRRFGRARSLRSDRMLGHYVATELWLELGRYVATEWNMRSVAASAVCKSCGISEDDRILTKRQILGSRIKRVDSRFFRKAFRKEESISKKYLSKKVSTFSSSGILMLTLLQPFSCFAMLQGFSLSPAFEKRSCLTTDVRSQNCCSCLDANNLICDREIWTEPPSGGKRLFVHDATSILEFSSSQMFSMLFRGSLGTTETKRNALVNEVSPFAVGAVAAGVVLPALLQTTTLSFVFPDIVLIKRFVAEKVPDICQTTRQAIRTRNYRPKEIRNRKREQKEFYSESAYERYNKVEALATRAVGEILSSNNLRLQNLVESQLEITKTESCLIALSAKFALKKCLSSMPLA
uniref:Uncharacterized protein n=1 Tax=Brassica oleracea var. oleracea TaxID=109376 RepID=A0A0D3A9W8_BRAOL